MPDFGGIAEKAYSGAASLLFSEKDIVFSSNHKSLIVEIGGVRLPLQPLIEVRQSKNWVITEVAASGADPDLKGTSVKENMGLSDARITITGYLMSSDPPGLGLVAPSRGVGQLSGWAQTFGNSESGVLETRRWIEQLKDIKQIFDATEPLRIEAVPADGEGDDFLGVLGITHVLFLNLAINEKPGYDMKAYTIYLVQDRAIEIEKLLPTEEGEGE